MKKTTLALGLCLALATTAGAQKQGGISASMLQQIEKSQGSTATNKALFNAVASNRIDNLAKNFSNRNTFDTHFSVETTKQSIHDQKSSGRCWMFSSFNVFRADFARHHADSLSVEFSHDYLFFYDQLEKANLMLQGVIDNAKKKLARKGCDLIVANDVTRADSTFGSDTDAVTLVGVHSETEYPCMPKAEVANVIVSELAHMLEPEVPAADATIVLPAANNMLEAEQDSAC